MKKILSLFLASAFFISSFAHALEIEGVEVPDTLQQEAQALNLNGAGVRNKMWMDLYVASFYTATAVETTDDALAESLGTSVVRLNIISSMITSEKMAGAIMEGLEKATGNNIASIQAEADQFAENFAGETKVGDEFTFVSKPGVGIEVHINGEQASTVEGEAFRSALLAVWLGENVDDEKLRDALLGD